MYFDGEKPYQEDKKLLPYQMKLDLWEASFGLQAVDGLKPSKYMIELAKENIIGSKDYQKIEQELHAYYYSKEDIDYSTREADLVSLRITELLSDDYFQPFVATLVAIHEHLFREVLGVNYAGKFRNVNITKNEEVLNGSSVQYASHFLIKQTLNYDFEEEKQIDYSLLNERENAERVFSFISKLWQIHPFREGNTRTIAVFTIKYLRKLGFMIDNEPFKEHSLFFRDALVLDNVYGKLQTNQFLRQFMENVLFRRKNKLSREKMIEWRNSILK